MFESGKAIYVMYGKERKDLFESKDNEGNVDTTNQGVEEVVAGQSETSEVLEEYSLYTEKIVERPFEKYRKVISLCRLIVKAAVFGLVACAVFIVAYPHISKILGISVETGKRSALVIPKDEYPTERDFDDDDDVKGIESDILDSNGATEEESLVQLYAPIRQMMVATRECMVTIVSAKSSIDEFINEGITGYETAGLVVGEIDSEYIIITNYEAVKNSVQTKVRFSDNTEAEAYVINVEPTTGLAMLCVKQIEISSFTKSNIKIAQLDNSYLVAQGDIVIAAGRLLGRISSVNCGVATNIKGVISGVDACYGIISTNMLRQEGDYGFLFNSSGNVIGIIQKNTASSVLSDSGATTFNAYGISDLKALIVEMSNGTGITYFGVVGQSVTHSIAQQYNLPTGVFIAEVMDNSPAFDAGLQPGDVITSIDGETVLTFQSFSEKLYQHNVGDSVKINVKRFGRDEYKDIEFHVTLRVK